MPYINNDELDSPELENFKIWRYMDLAKFISVLDSKGLFFTRADLFEDDYEGSFTKINYQERIIQIDQHMKHLRPWSKPDPTFYIHLPKYIGVNCWHINESESAAMWKLYLKSNEGIAIQSTLNFFKESIEDRENVYIKKVNYIDYDKDKIDNGNNMNLFASKRKSFAHEQELRAMVYKVPYTQNKEGFPAPLETDNDENAIKGGIVISMNLEQLIQNVYVAPTAPKWFLEVVKSVIKAYGYSFSVINSEMDGKPLR